MYKRTFDIIVILGLSILFLIFYKFFPGNLLNTMLGMLFILIFPGYVLVAAIYGDEHKISLPHRLALSCVMSLTIVTLLALALNAIGYLSATRQILGIVLIMIVSSAVALYRRFFKYKGTQLVEVQESFKISMPLNPVLIGIVVISSFIVFGVIINLINTGPARTNTTAFYLLGEGGKAGDYPSQVNLGSPFPITIGIINNENETISYLVDVQIDQHDPETLASVVLKPGEKWEGTFDLVLEQADDSQAFVGFNLYKGFAGGAYRSLHFWTQIVENDSPNVWHTQPGFNSLLGNVQDKP